MSRAPIIQLDRLIGLRIKRARLLRGLTQTDLAKELGVSYQQVQKYEYGASKITATTLFRVAEVLHKHIGWFFHGVSERTPAAGGRFG